MAPRCSWPVHLTHSQNSVASTNLQCTPYRRAACTSLQCTPYRHSYSHSSFIPPFVVLRVPAYNVLPTQKTKWQCCEYQPTMYSLSSCCEYQPTMYSQPKELIAPRCTNCNEIVLRVPTYNVLPIVVLRVSAYNILPFVVLRVPAYNVLPKL